MIFLFKQVIFRFHVHFPGCMSPFLTSIFEGFDPPKQGRNSNQNKGPHLGEKGIYLEVAENFQIHMMVMKYPRMGNYEAHHCPFLGGKHGIGGGPPWIPMK